MWKKERENKIRVLIEMDEETEEKVREIKERFAYTSNKIVEEVVKKCLRE